MNTTVRFLLTAIALLAMVNHAHADTAREDVEVVLEAGEIDSSTVEVGALAVVVYRQGRPHPILRGWEKLVTTRGYVQAVDAETLTLALERNGRSQRIALDRIQTLTLVGSPSSEAARGRTPVAVGIVSETIAAPSLGGANRDSMQIASGYVESQVRETPDTLSVKTDDMGTSRRIVSKLVAGTLSGIGGFFGGFVLGAILDDGGWTPLILGIWIGYPVGSAIGVSLVEPQDRFIHPLIGSFLGFGAAALTKSDINVLIFPPILATLASEFSRFDNLPPIFMSRSPPRSSRFSVGLVPNSTGHLSAVATLRF